MNYKIHRLKINLEKNQDGLEKFLNSLSGEVVSIIPSIKKLSLFQIYGVTQRVDSLIVVEKL